MGETDEEDDEEEHVTCCLTDKNYSEIPLDESEIGQALILMKLMYHIRANTIPPFFIMIG